MADKPTYAFRQSPNFTPRKARPISAVVIHYTASMNIDGTISWFLTPASAVSAHYVVGRDGQVVQMVNDNDIAWHAGRSLLAGQPNVNQFSIGIELVGTADSGYTDRQLASLYSLLEILVSRYKIPPDRIVGHSTVAPGRKIDPDGYHDQFNWAKARQVAQVAYNAATAATAPVFTTPAPTSSGGTS